MKNNIKVFSTFVIVSVLLCSCANNNTSSTHQDTIENNAYSEQEEAITTTEVEEIDPIDSFVEEFNSYSDTDLIYVEDFTPSDSSGSHYRTEFRLNAYSDAIAKSYSYDGTTVDLVYKEDYFGDGTLRVYMDGATFEQCENMIRFASPVLDDTITEQIIDETIDYINNNVIAGHREANGYLYSELAIVFFEREEGCSLMIKMRND